MSKSKRLIELIMCVNRKKKFTVRELAEEFGVSYRTMWRDLQELGELGVPLYSEPGAHGGYQILHEVELPAALRMNHAPTIEGHLRTLPAYQAVGYEFTAPYSARGEAEVLVPRLWFQLLAKTDEMAAVIRPVVKRGLALHREKDFTYYVTVGVELDAAVPEGLVRVEVPEHEYACFTHVGSVERVSVDETFQMIFDWLTQQGLQREPTVPWIELFDERFNPTVPDHSFDIYIPVTKRDE